MIIKVRRVPEAFEALQWVEGNTEEVLAFLPTASYVGEVRYKDVHKPEHIWPDGAGKQSLQVGDWAIKPENSSPFALTPDQFALAFEEEDSE